MQKYGMVRKWAAALCIVLGSCCCAFGQTDGGAGRQAVSPHSYTVRKGDCLAKILREGFGVSDQVIFSPRTQELLRAANPHLQNISQLHEGEIVHVPPQLAGETESPNAFARKDARPAADTPAPEPAASPEAASAPSEATSGIAERTEEPDHELLEGEGDRGQAIHEMPILPADSLEREREARRLLALFADALGGRENTSCEKKLVAEGAGSFTLDCSKFPTYEFPWGASVILDFGGRLPAPAKKIMQSAWGRTGIVSVSDGSTEMQVLDKAVSACGLQKLERGNRFMISRGEAQVSASGDWILFNEAAQKHTIILSAGGDHAVPGPLKMYLETLGIDFIALSRRAGDCPPQAYAASRPAETRSDPAAFTERMLDVAGIDYERNVKIKVHPQHETGITLELNADRKFISQKKNSFNFL